MGYLVKGKTFTSYYDMKFGRSKFKPFAIFFGDAKDEDAAIEMARREIESNRCETSLITSVEEFRNSPGNHMPYGVDYELPWYQQKIIAWDVETTGLSPKDDRIIEIGYATYNLDTKKFENPQSFFINDGHPVSDKITQLTGITQEDIDDAPPFAQVWSAHLAQPFKEAAIGLAHNRGFDIGFLLNSLKRIEDESVGSIPQTVCTMELALRSDLDTKNNKLATLGGYLDIDGVNSHRAGEDAELCGNVGLALFRRHRYFHTANTRDFFNFFDKYSWAA